jgi:TPR repeat protein
MFILKLVSSTDGYALFYLGYLNLEGIYVEATQTNKELVLIEDKPKNEFEKAIEEESEDEIEAKERTEAREEEMQTEDTNQRDEEAEIDVIDRDDGIVPEERIDEKEKTEEKEKATNDEIILQEEKPEDCAKDEEGGLMDLEEFQVAMYASDEETAFAYFQSSAATGNAQGLYSLGGMLELRE